MSLTLYMLRVIVSLYAESRRHFYNLTDMRRKALACFGLHVGMVPKTYQHGWKLGDHDIGWAESE
jgi:hypothetical protein